MCTVAVKPLEWRPHEFFPYSDDCRVAKVALFNHAYQVQRDPWGPGYVAYLHPAMPITDSTKWWESKGHADLEAAEAAAQTDFEARIRSAITEGAPS